MDKITSYKNSPSEIVMIVTAWNNGSHHKSGAGYGLKLTIADRDQYFKREWGTVTLELEGYPKPVEVNIDKDSFWGPKCRELIGQEIGAWLRKNGAAPWVKGKPPMLRMEPQSGNRFFVQLPKRVTK